MMKRIVPMLVVVVMVALMAPSLAFAKKKVTSRDDFQAGFDVGTYIYGVIPYGSWENTKNDLDGSISGQGGMGPIIGAHFNLMAASSLIIHLDIAYSYQGGDATWEFDDEDVAGQKEYDFDYGMNMFRGSVGIGKYIARTGKVLPYYMGGLGLHYLTFSDKDWDESASGGGVGLWGALGVDAKLLKSQGMQVFAGGQVRMDMIYTVNPLEHSDSDTDISMFYIPLQILLTAGVMF